MAVVAAVEIWVGEERKSLETERKEYCNGNICLWLLSFGMLYLACGGLDSHFGFTDTCCVGDDTMGKKAKKYRNMALAHLIDSPLDLP